MDTFAVITTEPNELLAGKTGHDRMRVIIRRQDYQRWLEPGSDTQPHLDTTEAAFEIGLRSEDDDDASGKESVEQALWKMVTIIDGFRVKESLAAKARG
jgi:putative SOS response-associated peptidase YedK